MARTAPVKKVESIFRREKPLPYALPDLSDDEIAAAVSVLKSGWLTSGPETLRFEEEFAKKVDVRNALAVNSATSALHLGLVAAGIESEHAVILPSITFTATAEVVTYQGALPLILDVDRKEYLITPEMIHHFIKKECSYKNSQLIHKESGKVIKAIMPVHLAGRPCDMNGILQIAKKYNLFIIEDAAHAYPTVYNGKMIGSIGDMTAFSFYATKNLTTGEGGMLTTNNDAIARKLRRIRLHGIKGQTYGRKRWKYDVTHQGYKYNMMDICAAIGRVQLRRMDSMMERRNTIVQTYREAFQKISSIRMLPETAEPNSNHLFTIEIDKKFGRDRFVEELYAKNIGSSLHFIPLYRHTYYKKTYGLIESNYPNSEEIYKSIVSLPLYSKLTDSDVNDVIRAVTEILT